MFKHVYLDKWKAAISPLCLSSPANGSPSITWSRENLSHKEKAL